MQLYSIHKHLGQTNCISQLLQMRGNEGSALSLCSLDADGNKVLRQCIRWLPKQEILHGEYSLYGKSTPLEDYGVSKIGWHSYWTPSTRI